MNAQILRQVSMEGHERLVDRHLENIAALGVGSVRASVDWHSLEPSPPVAGQRQLDWAAHDKWVEALARHGLRWHLTAIGITTPAWNRSPESEAMCAERSPPTAESFASLMAALAGRYGTGGSFWGEHPELQPLPVRDFELWNEPNFGTFWCPKPDPEGYAKVAVEAAIALKETDRHAQAVLGGLAGFTSETAPLSRTPAVPVGAFATRIVAAEPALATEIDAVAIHPYARGPDEVVENVRRFRNELDAAGFAGQELHVNEIGWPTSGVGGPQPVPEARRAEFFSKLPKRVVGSDCDVEFFAAHTWTTYERDVPNPEDWFGMADPVSGAPYASASSYGDSVRSLQGRGVAAPQPSAPCRSG